MKTVKRIIRAFFPQYGRPPVREQVKYVVSQKIRDDYEDGIGPCQLCGRTGLRPLNEEKLEQRAMEILKTFK